MIIENCLRTFAQANIQRKHLDQKDGSDIFTSQEWKSKVLDRDLHKSNAGRDLVLCFLADGVCPFSRRKQHSMDVHGFYVMNLDKRFRNCIRNVILSGIVCGPEAVKTEQPYLLSLVIQLLEIQRDGGVIVEDVLNPGHFFTVRLHVLWTLGDLPAHCKVWSWSEKGYSGCSHCSLKGERQVGRVTYPFEKPVMCRPVAGRDPVYIHKYPQRDPLDILNNSLKAHRIRYTGVKKDLREHRQANGTKDLHCLAILGLSPVLSGWYDLMHVLKGWFVHLMYTFKGLRTPKRAVNMSVQELVAAEEFQMAQAVNDLSGIQLTSSQMARVEARQDTLYGPARFAVRGKKLFKDASQFKIREQQNVMTSAGRYLFSGIFHGTAALMLHCAFELLAALSGPSPVGAHARKRFQDLAWTTLYLYQVVMPTTEHAIIIHLTRHLVEQMLRIGPLVTCYTWERFCGWLGRLIGGTANPELNAMNAYSTFLWVTDSLNVIGLVGKLQELKSQKNMKALISDTMVNDLFDVASSFMSKEYELLMEGSRLLNAETVRRLTRCHFTSTFRAGARYTVDRYTPYRRAWVKGRLLGVAGSLERNSWVTLSGGLPGQIIQFVRVDVTSCDEGKQVYQFALMNMMTKDVRVVDGQPALFWKRPSMVKLTLLSDIKCLIALGRMDCSSESLRGAIVPRDHPSDCVDCRHMLCNVCNFDFY